VHVLVLHFTVVLVPITAVATTAVFLYGPWREAYGGRMVVANLVMLALTFVTVRAGLDLENRYRTIGNSAVPRNDHEALGRTLLWIVLALAIATVCAWSVGRRTNLPEAAGLGIGVVVGALAVASLVFTVLTGHTGSKSHWEDFVKTTNTN
jgi:hypothetical protein